MTYNNWNASMLPAIASFGGQGTPVPANQGFLSPQTELNFGANSAVPAPGVPGAAGGWFDKIGGMQGIGTAFQGLGSLGQIYSSIKALGLAEDQLDFSKQAFETNLKNSTKSYNTALEDRIRARYHSEGRAPSKAAEYIAKHSL